jgi:hypothetical protein
VGKQDFIQYAEGVDLDTAFNAAIKKAQHEYGHGGFTGTIAEKEDFGCFALTDEPMTLDEATALANQMLDERDERCVDWDLPACAIPVRGGERTFTDLTVPALPAGYASREAAAAAAAAAQLTVGETVTEASLSHYDVREHGRIVVDPRCRVSCTTAGSSVQTGWLFFGYAER